MQQWLRFSISAIGLRTTKRIGAPKLLLSKILHSKKRKRKRNLRTKNVMNCDCKLGKESKQHTPKKLNHILFTFLANSIDIPILVTLHIQASEIEIKCLKYIYMFPVTQIKLWTHILQNIEIQETHN